ncbi:hypothetical protein PF005_g5040 [Phytophthora fragariae]|nr:hypothetical protein PF003_g21691 [Phytophthora fragariae]KAE8946269.1 hypothetical protein PF009_g4078 [Phytophthora fragariae]KAE9129399.1 hypothetical protein PF007_g4909 [Phytophthora fragariae]KAE9146219.1 hypothetical protein PF006_g8999 [Phytophthora fragariae]KAE9226692.1 hypothetical protein PF005_g5040 [Phytophthora fragariae]
MRLPVVLYCDTNNEEYHADPFYIGLRQKCGCGEKFEQLVDVFMNASKAKYGGENKLCTFNDDTQDTASAVFGGLLAAEPLSGKSISEQNFIFLGAGTAGTGIADLRETGKTVESRKQIKLADSRSLIAESRMESLQPHKLPYAHDAPEYPNLVETLDRIKTMALIGVCTIAKAFNEMGARK